ncbi:MAG: hypothetical protein PHE21_02440 [Candidatus Dojkabacteria bacterium]|nr:hypothetical protein [Candidatus Dojkabacteria bacterium]
MSKSKTIIIGIAIFVLLGVGALVYFLFSKENDVVADAPTGCPKSTSIVVQSEEAGTQKITSANSNFIHWREDQALLVFTNYTLNVDSVYSDITGNKVLAVVKLSNEDATNVGVGTYKKYAEDGTSTPNLYSPEYNISTEGLAGGVFDDNASVQIDYFGDDYVCGTVTSDDGDSSINGQFIAKYINKL